MQVHELLDVMAHRETGLSTVGRLEASPQLPRSAGIARPGGQSRSGMTSAIALLCHRPRGPPAACAQRRSSPLPPSPYVAAESPGHGRGWATTVSRWELGFITVDRRTSWSPWSGPGAAKCCRKARPAAHPVGDLLRCPCKAGDWHLRLHPQGSASCRGPLSRQQEQAGPCFPPLTTKPQPGGSPLAGAWAKASTFGSRSSIPGMISAASFSGQRSVLKPRRQEQGR